MDFHKTAENFFSQSAKLTIFIPIVIILLALGFKAYTMIYPTTPASDQNLSASSYESNQPSLTTHPVPTTKPIDLTGPYICSYETKDSTASAYIKDKKVYIENKKIKETDYMVLQGDCLYLWEKGSYSGDKLCGLSQYLSLVDTFSQFKLLGQLAPNMATSAINNLSSSISTQSSASLKSLDITKALNSCEKKSFTNTSIFTIPQNVLFKNIDVSELTKKK